MTVPITTIRVRKRWIAVLLVIGALIGAMVYADRGKSRHDAVAYFVAGPQGGDLTGFVTFRNVAGGVEATAKLDGLPTYSAGSPPVGPHGFHIHEGTTCEVGDHADPFQGAGGHWNPDGQPHGDHAGDFPVLFANDGGTFMTFFTDRFSVEDVMGRAVIVHLHPDDYRTQPAGDSGLRIACGIISRP